MVFAFPSNCYVFWGSASHEVAGHLPADGRQWMDSSFCFASISKLSLSWSRSLHIFLLSCGKRGQARDWVGVWLLSVVKRGKGRGGEGRGGEGSPPLSSPQLLSNMSASLFSTQFELIMWSLSSVGCTLVIICKASGTRDSVWARELPDWRQGLGSGVYHHGYSNTFSELNWYII